MVHSINTKAELSVEATSYYGLPEYGKLLLGNQGFEFFSDRDVRRNIQIPWKEISHISASVLFGKWIVRYCVYTKSAGTFSFASKKPKEVLTLAGKYIGADQLVYAKTLVSVIKK